MLFIIIILIQQHNYNQSIYNELSTSLVIHMVNQNLLQYFTSNYEIKSHFIVACKNNPTGSTHYCYEPVKEVVREFNQFFAVKFSTALEFISQN